MDRIVKVLSVDQLTHDVHSFRIEKPKDYSFIPGQATEVAINKPGWEKEKRPFTFASLNEEEHLEFIIKSYSDHKGVTNELLSIRPGDELIIDDVWGAIEYKGPGYFIAGGAGITPFIAIFRQLAKDRSLSGNHLFFSNKTRKDIILENELSSILKDNVQFVVTDEPAINGSSKAFIDEAFLRKHIDDISKHFYICGPQPMTEAITDIVVKLGASPEAVVFEK